jgi:hypothetical protein
LAFLNSSQALPWVSMMLFTSARSDMIFLWT